VKAVGTVLATLHELAVKGEAPAAVSMHSFGGPAEFIPQLLALEKLGVEVYFGFSKSVNCGNSQKIMKFEAAVSRVPLDRVLVESDLDEPSAIDDDMVSIGRVLAGMIDKTFAEVCKLTTENAQRFYRCGGGGSAGGTSG
jgi:Tat protein secretion system quality control protein TatD with DNase activity